MALPITLAADYTGRVEISTSKGTQLDEYIVEFEPEYIKLLVNNDVYSEINSLANPLPSKYLELINGVEYTDSSGDLQIYQGIKPLLLRFVYARYNQDNFQTSIGGNVRSSNENSTVLTAENTSIVVNRYNEAVRLYRDEVCLFLEEHEDLTITVVSSVDNTGTYTLTVASTKYLTDGDLITIGSTDYTVSNLVTDTSLDITEAVAALDFAGDIIKYKPYFKFCPKNIKYSSWL